MVERWSSDSQSAINQLKIGRALVELWSSVGLAPVEHRPGERWHLVGDVTAGHSNGRPCSDLWSVDGDGPVVILRLSCGVVILRSAGGLP